MSLIGGIFLFVAFIILAISGGFITNSAIRITDIPAYDADSNLKAAHTKATWAAVITWIAVALVLGMALFYYFYVSKKVSGFGKIVIYILFFISMIAVIIVGILAGIAATDINKSSVSDNKGSCHQAVIATVTAIIGFVFLLAGFIFVVYSKYPKKKPGDSPAELEKENQELPSWAEDLPETSGIGENSISEPSSQGETNVWGRAGSRNPAEDLLDQYEREMGYPEATNTLADQVNDMYMNTPGLRENIRQIAYHPKVQGIIRNPKVQDFFNSIGQNPAIRNAFQNFFYR